MCSCPPMVAPAPAGAVGKAQRLPRPCRPAGMHTRLGWPRSRGHRPRSGCPAAVPGPATAGPAPPHPTGPRHSPAGGDQRGIRQREQHTDRRAHPDQLQRHQERTPQRALHRQHQHQHVRQDRLSPAQREPARPTGRGRASRRRRPLRNATSPATSSGSASAASTRSSRRSSSW